jgi:hypothetical protein
LYYFKGDYIGFPFFNDSNSIIFEVKILNR